jgi:hypothetical protein
VISSETILIDDGVFEFEAGSAGLEHELRQVSPSPRSDEMIHLRHCFILDNRMMFPGQTGPSLNSKFKTRIGPYCAAKYRGFHPDLLGQNLVAVVPSPRCRSARPEYIPRRLQRRKLTDVIQNRQLKHAQYQLEGVGGTLLREWKYMI